MNTRTPRLVCISVFACLCIGSAGAEDPPIVFFSQTINRRVEQCTYTLRLVEVENHGVIGVELVWKNHSSMPEMLVRGATALPVYLSVGHKLDRLALSERPQVASGAGMISLPKGLEGKPFLPASSETYFAALGPFLDRRAVAERLEYCTIYVRPVIHVLGKERENADYPLPNEKFTKCILTPEGLAMDAQKLYRQIVRNER